MLFLFCCRKEKVYYVRIQEAGTHCQVNICLLLFHKLELPMRLSCLSKNQDTTQVCYEVIVMLVSFQKSNLYINNIKVPAGVVPVSPNKCELPK